MPRGDGWVCFGAINLTWQMQFTEVITERKVDSRDESRTHILQYMFVFKGFQIINKQFIYHSKYLISVLYQNLNT